MRYGVPYMHIHALWCTIHAYTYTCVMVHQRILVVAKGLNLLTKGILQYELFQRKALYKY